MHGFENAFDDWFKETNECILALGLLKSNFSNIFYLNIKTYIHGLFGRHYSKSKDLINKEVGNIFRRHPNEYNDVFDLDLSLDYSIRKENLKKLFKNFIVPYSNAVLTRKGIRNFQKNKEISLLPAVENELDLLP